MTTQSRRSAADGGAAAVASGMSDGRRGAALVAGGAGFLGSHLCERLLASGQAVVCLDNHATGDAANIAHLRDREDFLAIDCDVTEALPAVPPVRWVYHLASPASPRGYSRRPIETLRANSLGTEHLLQLAREQGAAFLFASTSEVYGDSLVHPQPETYRGNVSTTGPRSMYDEGKRYGEALTMAYHRAFGLDARIVRLFNAYGPRMAGDDGRIVPTFVTQALRGEPLTVHGDGSQTRSLCYVTDTVDGIVRALETAGTAGEVINIGSPEEHAVLEFARRVRTVAGSSSTICFVPHDVGDDPARRCPDIAKARRILGWEPRVTLDDGLARTCAWFRAHSGAAACAH